MYCKVLLLHQVPELYERVQRHLPDVFRNPASFTALYRNPTSAFFSVGDFGAAVWLTDIIPGGKATIHVKAWDKELKGKPDLARKIVEELMTFYSLQRLEGWIPVVNRMACIYVEKVGFSMEGVLRKAAYYDGRLVDVAVYSLLKEDM